MSIFDHLLVLIDDQNGLTVGEIETRLPDQSKQIIGSTLGRLVSRGSLERVTTGGAEIYRITESGNSYISRILNSIHRHEDSWNNQWFCVLVTLPETQRKQRDILRHFLLDRGFGRLIDGFYISPRERRAEIADIIRRLNIGSAVSTFETQPLGLATGQVVVQQAWNWPELTRQIEAFITDVLPKIQTIEAASESKNSSTDDLRLQAKLFVFGYALLLSADANLPMSIIPDPRPYQTALNLYERVRKYCYR